MTAHRVAPLVVALLLGATAPLIHGAVLAQTPAATRSGSHPVIYVEITGPHGLFHGDGLTAKSAKPSDIAATNLSFEADAPRDPRTGIATGKRQYKPVTFTHEVGPASIDLLNALAKSEPLTKVVITIYKVDNNGLESKHYTVQLSTAAVTAVRQFSEEARMYEEVTIAFEKIEVALGNAQFAFVDDLLR
jgi:type VI secretion system Hcp family effector